MLQQSAAAHLQLSKRIIYGDGSEGAGRGPQASDNLCKEAKLGDLVGRGKGFEMIKSCQNVPDKSNPAGSVMDCKFTYHSHSAQTTYFYNDVASNHLLQLTFMAATGPRPIIFRIVQENGRGSGLYKVDAGSTCLLSKTASNAANIHIW